MLSFRLASDGQIQFFLCVFIILGPGRETLNFKDISPVFLPAEIPRFVSGSVFL